MVWHMSSIRPSVNIWLSTRVTTRRINLSFTDIIHLVCPIHDTGNGPCRSLNNMRILTQLLISAFWSFLRPFLPRGQFWPSGIVIACVYVSVRVCVCINHLLVLTITHQPFKLESLNLDQRCSEIQRCRSVYNPDHIWDHACACHTREAPVTQSATRVGSSLLDSSMLLLFRQPITCPIIVFTSGPTCLLVQTQLQSI